MGYVDRAERNREATSRRKLEDQIRTKVLQRLAREGVTGAAELQSMDRPWLFRPGVSGNPGGKPAGYVPIDQAYVAVGMLSPSDLRAVARGKSPKDPAWKGRKITAQLMRAAAETLSAMPRGTPKEINDRTDGPLAQKLETASVSYVIEVPAAVSDSLAWSRVIEADVVPREPDT